MNTCSKNSLNLCFLFIAFAFISCANEKNPPLTQAVPKNPLINREEPQITCNASFQKSGFCVNYQWEALPSEDTEGSFILKIFSPSPNGQNLVMISTNPIPKVMLWMPSMGHSSSPTQVALIELGTYRVSHVYFTMHGNWQIRFQLNAGAVIQDEAIVDLTE